MKRALTLALCVLALLALACAAALAEPRADVELTAGFETGADPCVRTCFDETDGEEPLISPPPPPTACRPGA